MHRILIAAVLFVLLAPSALAQDAAVWGYGLPVCVEPKYEAAPVTVSDGSGGAIIVWTDYRNGTYDFMRGWQGGDIYAQKITSGGTVLWQAGGVPVCTSSGDQHSVRAVPDGSGGAIIAWTDARSGPLSSDLYAQRVDSGGTCLWEASGVAVCTASNAQNGLQMVSDGAGGAILAWYDLRNATFDTIKMLWVNSDIYAQRINGLGQALWTANGVAVCSASLDQYGPVLIPDDGGAIIAWFDYRSATWDQQKKAYVNTDIYAQKLSGSGTPQWTSNGVAVCSATRDQYSVQIASDGAGGAIMAWTDCRTAATDPNIHAQRVNSSGVPQWTANGIAVCVEDFEQFVSAVVPDSSGGAYVIWEDYRTDSEGDVYVQQISASGTMWPVEKAVSASRAAEYGVTAGPDGLGNVIVVYHFWTQATRGDIRAQKVAPNGDFLWQADGAIVCDHPAHQQSPSFCLGSNGPIFAWDDDRPNDPDGAIYITDIYAQRFGSVPEYESVADVRLLPDGSVLALSGKVVTAKFADHMCSYIEDADRSAGIKVAEDFWSLPPVGRLCGVTGRINTVGGERQIEPTGAPADLGPGTIPAPIGLGLSALGGGPVLAKDEVRVPGLAGCAGANNVGLLVRVWGRTSYSAPWDDPDWPYFYVDDGSGLADTSGHTGVRVVGDASIYGIGTLVAVTGISSTWLPSGQVIPAKAVRALDVRLAP